MTKRLHQLLAALVITLATGVAWLTLRRPSEPVYKGRGLSAWLEGYDYYRTNWVTDQLDRREADEAIHDIGTNALPLLLNMLQARDSDLKLEFIKLAKKQRLIRVDYVTDRERAFQAAQAFQILGASGSNAVTALIEIFNRNISASSQDATAIALGSIGPAASNAVPSLLCGLSKTNYSVLPNSFWALSKISARADLVVPVMVKFLQNTNASLRDQAISVIRTFGAQAKTAVPALLELLKDQNNQVRQSAEIALGAIRSEPALVVPALMKCIHDPDINIRSSAFMSIASFQTEAAAAAPELFELLKAPDINSRIWATDTLGYIHADPKVLVPILVKSLDDSHADIRANAAFVLGIYGGEAKTAVPRIFKLLGDPDESVRKQATNAVKAITSESATKARVKLMEPD